MTDTDYFYTSKLYYAAAAIEQGFEGVQTYDKNCVTGKMQWSNVLDLNTEYQQWRFPKTTHNVALMNKQEFDVVKQIGKTIAFNKVGIIEYDLNRKLIVRHRGFDDKIIDDWVITERNNKPFPVWIRRACETCEILGFDYAKQNGEYSAEAEGYHDDDGVLHITNIYRWNQTIEHNDKEGV